MKFVRGLGVVLLTALLIVPAFRMLVSWISAEVMGYGSYSFKMGLIPYLEVSYNKIASPFIILGISFIKILIVQVIGHLLYNTSNGYGKLFGITMCLESTCLWLIETCNMMTINRNLGVAEIKDIVINYDSIEANIVSIILFILSLISVGQLIIMHPIDNFSDITENGEDNNPNT